MSKSALPLVIDNMHAINAALRNLEFFTNYYTYLTWILPILVVAPSYFSGLVELGVVQQAASSFSHVLDDLSILVTQWESLSEFSAGIDRLYTFLSVIQDLDPDRPEGAHLMALPGKQSAWTKPPTTTIDGSSSDDGKATTTMIHLIQRPPSRPDDVATGTADPALKIQNLCLVTPGVSRRVLIPQSQPCCA